MSLLRNALYQKGLPEYDVLMVFKRVSGFGDYEGIFTLSGAPDDEGGNSAEDSGLHWQELDADAVYESEFIAPIVFEDHELGYVRALHREEGMYSPSSKSEFAPFVAQMASLLLSPEGEDYRRSVERSFRLLEWLETIRLLNPKKLDWLGLYFHEYYYSPDRELGDLLLGPFIGEPTEHVRIGLDRGICGLALTEEQTIQVDDVRNNERHIACSLSTRSELVIPLKDEAGEFIAELDLDSNKLAAFDSDLRKEIESLAEEFHEYL